MTWVTLCQIVINCAFTFQKITIVPQFYNFSCILSLTSYAWKCLYLLDNLFVGNWFRVISKPSSPTILNHVVRGRASYICNSSSQMTKDWWNRCIHMPIIFLCLGSNFRFDWLGVCRDIKGQVWPDPQSHPNGLISWVGYAQSLQPLLLFRPVLGPSLAIAHP